MRESNDLVSVIIVTYNRKDKLQRLIKSVKKSVYKNMEVILIDDCSSDGTSDLIRYDYPDVMVVQNNRELRLSACRNLGARIAKGSYLFFIDDDNVIDLHTISSLVKTMSLDKRIAVLGPIAYYYSKKNMIWCAGTTRNKSTQFSKFIGHNQLNDDRYKISHLECDDFPNAFLIKREVFEALMGFDPFAFPTHLAEADLCERIRYQNLGKIILEPNAIVWHDIPVMSAFEAFSRYLPRSATAYEWERNRIILKKRYSSHASYISFLLLFEPMYICLFILLTVITREKLHTKYQIITRMFKGLKDAVFNTWIF